MNARTIHIERTAVTKPGPDGSLSEAMLIKERRSKKVGALPTKARMVLDASRRCLPADVAGAADLREDIGVSLGTLYGSMDSAEQCLEAAHGAGGFGHVTPSWYATGLPNATAAVVASMHNLGGPNITVLGHQSGIEAVLMGCRQLAAGRVRAVLAGGFDLPSERFLAPLRTAPEYRDAAAIRPGVGLVWLTPGAVSAPGAAAIIGWSQGILDDGAFRSGEFSGLIRSAGRGAMLRGRATIHVISPGRRERVDYLAATAPIYLIENIVDARESGVHALIVKGFGSAVACLLLDVPG